MVPGFFAVVEFFVLYPLGSGVCYAPGVAAGGVELFLGFLGHLAFFDEHFLAPPKILYGEPHRVL